MLLDEKAFAEELRKRAAEAGFFDVRISSAAVLDNHKAALSRWLEQGMHGEMQYMARAETPRDSANTVLPGAKAVLVFAASYITGEDNKAGTARVSKYATGPDYHVILRERLECLVPWLDSTLPGNGWRICVDSAPVMERAYAVQAGLGFIGRNTMLIAPRKGSFFFLAEIFTTADLNPDAPIMGSCGTCTRCIDACPTGAIVQAHVVDARKCISYLTIEKKTELTREEQESCGDWVFGCDICQDVCPYNKNPETSTIPEFAKRIVHTANEPEVFLEPKSNRQFARRFAGSPLLRAGMRRIQRLAMRLLQS